MEILLSLIVIGFVVTVIIGSFLGIAANSRVVRLERELLQLRRRLEPGGAERQPRSAGSLPAHEPPVGATPAQLITWLHTEIRMLKRRLAQLEDLFGRVTPAAPQPPAAAPESPMAETLARLADEVEAPPQPVPLIPPAKPAPPLPVVRPRQPELSAAYKWRRHGTERGEQEAAPAMPAASPPAAKKPVGMLHEPMDREWWSNLEAVVGKRWLTWVGALIIVASASFFLKFAFESGLLGPWARAAIILGVGLALIASGVRCLSSGMLALGHGLVGAGLAVLYVAIYTALAVYHMLTLPPALGLLVLVTAGGVALALKHDAMAIAVLATIGGYLAPVLAVPLADSRDVTFAYMLLLNLGVLAVALFRRWQLLDALALLGTIALYASWVHHYFTPEQYGAALTWLAAFFLVFLLLPFLYHLRTLEPAPLPRFVLSLLTGLLTISAANWVLQPGHPALLGTAALVMSACYLLLAIAFRLRIPADARAHNGFLVLAIAFATYAPPLLLNLNATTLAWAIEVPLLVYLGYAFRSVLTRHSGAVVMVLTVLRLAVCHLPLHAGPFHLLLNPSYGTVLAVPLAAWITAVSYHYCRRQASAVDLLIMRTLAIGGGLLALILTHVEIAEWFYFRLGGSAANTYFYYVNALTLWTLGAALFLAFGLVWNSLAARATGLIIVAGLFVGAVWVYSGIALDELLKVDGFLPFANYRFTAVLLALAIVFIYSYLHAQKGSALPAEERALPTILCITAGLGLLTLVHAETSLSYAWYAVPTHAPQSPLPQFVEALVWTIGAAAYLASGLLWRSRPARVIGLFILGGLTVTWVVLYAAVDINELKRIDGFMPFANFRFLTALAAAAIAFGYSWLHGRCASQLPAGEKDLPTTLSIVAGLGVICLAHAETAVYFDWQLITAAFSSPLTQQCIRALIWTAGAAAYLLAGTQWRVRAARLAGLLPLLVACLLAARGYDMGSHSRLGVTQPILLLFNLRFLVSLLAVGLTFAWAWWLRTRLRFAEDERQLGGWLYGSADFMLLALLSLEVYSFYSGVHAPGIPADQLASAALSIVWGLYALCFLSAGFMLRNRPVRAAALALFGVTTLKLLFVDFSYLNPGYRLLSSVVLGGLMILASYIYHRISRLLEPGATNVGDAAARKALDDRE